MILTIATISSMIIFIIMTLIIVNKISMLNRQHDDQIKHRKYKSMAIIERRYLTGNLNRVFQNHLDSGRIIDQFIISGEEAESFLLCHFSHASVENGTLEICMYDKKEEMIHRAYIKDIESFRQSDYMALPAKTMYVNIYYHQNTIEHDEFDKFYAKRNLSYHTIAKLESIAMLTFLLPLNDLVVNRFFRDRFNPNFQSGLFYVALSLAICISLINYMVMMDWMTKRFQGENK